ncbi:MAG: hypothetical protein NTX49_02130 [Chlamydiae bacterium]|nr:hypothetical protein [Chlamydiota bacterium]
MKTKLHLFGMIIAVCSPILAFSDTSLQPTYTSSAKHNSMAIDPKFRASDYKEAFDFLRKEKAPNKVCLNLIDGTALSNIIEMTLMANNTLFLVRYNTPKGIKVQAIELEQIRGVGYLE